MTESKAGSTRREFLKQAGLAGAGAIGVGFLASCSANGSSAASTEGEKESSSSTASASSSASDWLGEKPQVDEAQITSTLSYDVVVCGGGNAGIQAALAAAEGGASVAVLERSSEEDRKVKGEDVGCVNSQFLIERGFGPYDEGQIVSEFCLRAGGRANTELIRKYVANSGEAFDHMVGLVEWPDDRIKNRSWDSTDLSPLDDTQICIQQPLPAAEGEKVDYPIELGGYRTWASVVQFMGSVCHETYEGVAAFSRLDEVQQFSILKGQELGAEWHFETSAVVLEQDETGRVTGVVAEGPDGYMRFNAAKAVILTCGDFASNSTMTWALLTEQREWNERAGLGPDSLTGMSSCTGDGQKLACWAGGSMEPGPRATMSIGAGPNAPWGESPMLWLNAEGKRFMNEAATPRSVAEALRTARGGFTGVTDADWASTLRFSSLDHGSANFGRAIYYTEMVEDMEAVPLDDPAGGSVRSCTVAERNAATVYKASTLEKLAGFLGYTGEAAEAFLASVEHYNKLCHAGADSDFGKDACLMRAIETPPFYGFGDAAATEGKGNFGTCSVGAVTLCGVLTNGDLQVIDAEGNAIEGLYAAGNTIGGRYGAQYTTPFAGNSLGMAITHGRVAGKLATGQPVS